MIFFVIPDKLKDDFYLSTETTDFIRFAIEDLNLASEKFVTPLHRVMYYPQLEEYYERLEDDDSFLDE